MSILLSILLYLPILIFKCLLLIVVALSRRKLQVSILLDGVYHVYPLHMTNKTLNLLHTSGNQSGRLVSMGSRVAQWSKALHLSDRGVTTDPGLISGCITICCDCESHRGVHNWPSVVWVRLSLKIRI